MYTPLLSGLVTVLMALAIVVWFNDMDFMEDCRWRPQMKDCFCRKRRPIIPLIRRHVLYLFHTHHQQMKHLHPVHRISVTSSAGTWWTTHVWKIAHICRASLAIYPVVWCVTSVSHFYLLRIISNNSRLIEVSHVMHLRQVWEITSAFGFRETYSLYFVCSLSSIDMTPSDPQSWFLTIKKLEVCYLENQDHSPNAVTLSIYYLLQYQFCSEQRLLCPRRTPEAR